MHLWNDKEKNGGTTRYTNFDFVFSHIVYDEYSLPNKNKLERGNLVINIARLNLSMMTSYENVVSDIPFINAPRIHSLH
jgi:hypothetical protein